MLEFQHLKQLKPKKLFLSFNWRDAKTSPPLYTQVECNTKLIQPMLKTN